MHVHDPDENSMTEHNHDHPPPRLIAGPAEDMSLPQREVLTPMGRSTFRDANLEKHGFRYSFCKGCDDKLVEIVYLKNDGTTGTIIADIDSLFDTKIISRDDKPICLVTFKLLREIDNPISLHRAEVPIDSVSGGIVGKMLKGLLEYFLERVYGRSEAPL